MRSLRAAPPVHCWPVSDARPVCPQGRVPSVCVCVVWVGWWVGVGVVVGVVVRFSSAPLFGERTPRDPRATRPDTKAHEASYAYDASYVLLRRIRLTL